MTLVHDKISHINSILFFVVYRTRY